MPWLDSHPGADGRRYYYLRWREAGKVTTQALGPIPYVDAQERLAELLRETGREARGRPTDASHAVDGFYASRRAAGCQEGTVAFYRHRLDHLVAHLQSKPIRLWTRSDLEAYVNEKAATWGPRSVRALVSSCRAFISWARDTGLDVPDFVGSFRPKRTPRIEQPHLGVGQIKAVLSASRAHPFLEVPVHLAACAGLDAGSIRAATWENDVLVEGEHMTLIGRRQKSGAPRRTPVDEPLRSVLLRHRATHGPVCRDLPVSNGALYANLRRLFADAGIPVAANVRGRGQGRGFHLLRHSYLTLLTALAVDDPTRRTLACHSPGSTAHAGYLHTDEERLREAQRRVAAALA